VPYSRDWGDVAEVGIDGAAAVVRAAPPGLVGGFGGAAVVASAAALVAAPRPVRQLCAAVGSPVFNTTLARRHLGRTHQLWRSLQPPVLSHPHQWLAALAQ
jgi:hypothetical protein